MNCREVADFLSDYLDGTLPLRQRLTFRLHLLLCRDCRRYLDSFAATVKLTHSLGERPAEEDKSPIPEALVQAILTARGKKAP
jgi:predicted anti-sigma-YlaC factor YlaD